MIVFLKFNPTMLIVTLASLSLVFISLYRMDCRSNDFRYDDGRRCENNKHRNSIKTMTSPEEHVFDEKMPGSDDSNDHEDSKPRKQKVLRSDKSHNTVYDLHYASNGANHTKSSLHNMNISKDDKERTESSLSIPLTNSFLVQPDFQRCASCSSNAFRKSRKKSINTYEFDGNFGYEDISQRLLGRSSHIMPTQNAYTNSPRPSITRESSLTANNRLRNSSQSSTRRATVRNVTPIDNYGQEDEIQIECKCLKCLNGQIPSNLNAQTYEIQAKKKQKKRRSSNSKNSLRSPQITKDYLQYNGRIYNDESGLSQDKILNALREQQIVGRPLQTNYYIGNSTSSSSSLTNVSSYAKSYEKNESSEHYVPKVTVHRIGNESDSDSNTLR